MKPLFLLLVFASLALLLHAQPANSEIKKDPLMGRWRCSHKLMVEIRADGTAKHSGDVAGKWKPVATQTSERKYQIHWKDGLTVDAVILETSLKKYKAQNNTGFKYTAERVEE